MELNINNDVDKKRKTYYANSQKKCNDKCKKFAIKYTLNELSNAEKLENAIANSGMSSNAFIKMVLEKYINELE